MPQMYDRELPKMLQWDPGIIYDPVPEWWLQSLDDRLQVELVAVRIETYRNVLQAQVEGLSRAVEVLRHQGK